MRRPKLPDVAGALATRMIAVSSGQRAAQTFRDHHLPQPLGLAVDTTLIASATVSVDGQTAVDLPTRHADVMSAERPTSGVNRGGSTTVTARAAQTGGGSATVDRRLSGHAYRALRRRADDSRTTRSGWNTTWRCS